MTTSVIIQARLNSSRLPQKVLLPAPDGTPLLAVQIERVKRTQLVDQIILATTTNPEDDALEALADECEVACFRGSENDVLERYARCAAQHKIDTIVRLTGDCVFVDWTVIDHLVAKVQSTFWDYAKTHESYPEGLDVEVFTRTALKLAQQGARTAFDREHVTPWVRRETSAIYEMKHNPHLGHIRLSLDYECDYVVIFDVLERLGPFATLADIEDLYQKHPELWAPNLNVPRNEWLKGEQGIPA